MAKRGKPESRRLYCCGCTAEVESRQVSGGSIYPHRPDLSHKQFMVCPACKNYVGKGGVSIPTPELRKARNHIHAVLDPLWKRGMKPRGDLYAMLTEGFGRTYHTSDVRTLDEARTIYRRVLEIRKSLTGANPT